MTEERLVAIVDTAVKSAIATTAASSAAAVEVAVLQERVRALREANEKLAAKLTKERRRGEKALMDLCQSMINESRANH